jgi:hypothetical protein
MRLLWAVDKPAMEARNVLFQQGDLRWQDDAADSLDFDGLSVNH